MTLSELAELVAKKTGFNRDETWVICDELAQEMIRQLALGEPIKVRELGTILWVDRKKSQRRHPRTGKLVKVPKRYVLRFRPSAGLQQRGETLWRSTESKSKKKR